MTQRVVVIPYRRFGTPYLSHVQGSGGEKLLRTREYEPLHAHRAMVKVWPYLTLRKNFGGDQNMEYLH
jgi:hypothetical protein